MNNKIEIGRRILHLRNTKGISQEELAQKIDMSRSSLSQIENGNRNIQLIELKSLSEILNFSMDEIMSHDFSFDLKDVATQKELQVNRRRYIYRRESYCCKST